MSAEHDHHWLRIRLRTGTATQPFLINTVRPYVNTVLQTGMADSFSFFRQGGERPALQLYFKGQRDVLYHILQPNTVGHFKRFLPGHAIDCAPHETRPQRYGGPTGHFLSMLQYRASSEIVLEELHRHAAYWNTARALDIARRLHLHLLSRGDFRLPAAAEFFDQLAEHVQYECGKQPDLAARYAANAARLLDADRHWWHQLRENPPTDEHWQRWDSMQQIIGNSLARALTQGKLRERPAADLLRVQRRGNHDRAQLWSYYADFVRLTNNRLGITLTDEAYLYYSLAKSLHALSREQQTQYLTVAV